MTGTPAVARIGGDEGSSDEDRARDRHRHLDNGDLVSDADVGGTIPMWEWIGDEAANTFSY